MLLDANLLLYCVNRADPNHSVARQWLEGALNGPRRVALPWQTITAFLRISTHPRVFVNPLDSDQATAVVDAWLSCPTVWIPTESPRTWQIMAEITRSGRLTGNLIPDASLAALAIEHGLSVYSADSDFARIRGVAWVNPLD